jgi:hypothetical protein
VEDAQEMRRMNKRIGILEMNEGLVAPRTREVKESEMEQVQREENATEIL